MSTKEKGQTKIWRPVACREVWTQLTVMPNFWLFQVRQNIRDKYGIEKKQPTSKSDKQKAAMMEELKKEYGLDDEDARELEDKMKKVWSIVETET